MTRLIMLFMAVSISGQAQGAQAWLTGAVTRNLVDNAYFGGCMVAVNPSPRTILPGCEDGWVSFSCSGDFNSKSEGNLKFQNAQLAMVTGKQVALLVDDSKKHNGYCWARRIDVIN